ncbi:MAG TPA: carboxypeptidase-like regulatory domain-containing protein [Planctomycetota bacterium]|nr:carboxypeptidase-like regulatory domain-containing protein [Planctomycetota bacterium]
MTQGSDTARARSIEGSVRVRRPPPERRGFFASLPVTIRWGVPILVIAFLVHRFWPRVIAIRATGYLDVVAQTDGLSVDIFPFDDSGAGRYPPEPRETVQLESGALNLWRSDVPPTGLYLRVDSPVHGVAAVHVLPHHEGVALELGEPRRLVGRVEDRAGRGIAGATVHVLPHRYGPLLATVQTDAQGEFAVDRLSSSASFFTLRVQLDGYAVAEREVQRVDDVPVSVTLVKTRPVTGTVQLPAGIDPATLEIRALRVPGVRAPVLADGAFSIDGLPPPPTRARLLVAGLPETWTHAARRVHAGETGVRIAVVPSATVRGVVVTADRDIAVVGAYVEHEHGPTGGVGAYTDSRGRFALGRVPGGTIRLEAVGGTAAVNRAAEPGVVFGFTEVEVAPGQDVEGVVIRVAPQR